MDSAETQASVIAELSSNGNKSNQFTDNAQQSSSMSQLQSFPASSTSSLSSSPQSHYQEPQAQTQANITNSIKIKDNVNPDNAIVVNGNSAINATAATNNNNNNNNDNNNNSDYTNANSGINNNGHSCLNKAPITCAGCHKPIKDQYLLEAIGKMWHEHCLKCDCCDVVLATAGSKLYKVPLTEKILCKTDYMRVFGAKGVCGACNKTIQPFEMVMRANRNTYHMECFACQQCLYRFCVGDKFHLQDDHKIICVQCQSENEGYSMYHQHQQQQQQNAQLPTHHHHPQPQQSDNNQHQHHSQHQQAHQQPQSQQQHVSNNQDVVFISQQGPRFSSAPVQVHAPQHSLHASVQLTTNGYMMTDYGNAVLYNHYPANVPNVQQVYYQHQHQHHQPHLNSPQLNSTIVPPNSGNTNNYVNFQHSYQHSNSAQAHHTQHLDASDQRCHPNQIQHHFHYPQHHHQPQYQIQQLETWSQPGRTELVASMASASDNMNDGTHEALIANKRRCIRNDNSNIVSSNVIAPSATAPPSVALSTGGAVTSSAAVSVTENATSNVEISLESPASQKHTESNTDESQQQQPPLLQEHQTSAANSSVQSLESSPPLPSSADSYQIVMNRVITETSPVPSTPSTSSTPTTSQTTSPGPTSTGNGMTQTNTSTANNASHSSIAASA
ncbi:LIM domain only protein 3 [Fragariocoptes setiger]|uniref:LIM domain only protein 3 n=1 Tax=Fragariocoptes setiger TaxID=1670756 RepID=A0ABQ7SC41_9ACAR|nr:LIM domain only protein 3 [Fragariocoptes setiger]